MITGNVQIILKDADGTEHVYEDHNIVTNVADNMLNIPLSFSPDRGKIIPRQYFKPLKDCAFGGILLFSENITDNVNQIIPPSNVKETGHASGAYSGSNKWRGTLNTNESKTLDNEKGYKFVYDFATDKANGTIKSCALCPEEGGKVGFNGANADAGYTFQKVTGSLVPWTYDLLNPTLYLTQPTDYTYTPILALKQYQYVSLKSTAGSTKITFLIETIPAKVGLFDNLQKTTVTKEITTIKKVCANAKMFTDGSKIYSIYPYSTNKIDFIVINGITLEVEKEETLTIQDANLYTAGFPAYYKDYIYIGQDLAPHKNIYKINVNDATDYSLVEFPTTAVNLHVSQIGDLLAFVEVGSSNSYIGMYNGTDLQSSWFKVATSGVKNSYISSFKFINSQYVRPPYVAFSITSSSSSYKECSGFGVLFYNLSMSTIFNLNTPVVKAPTQTMKVTYTLQEVPDI